MPTLRGKSIVLFWRDMEKKMKMKIVNRKKTYHKYSDRHAWTNSVDPDQTA